MFSNKNNKYANSELFDVLDLFKNTEFIGKTENDKIPDIVGYGHIHTPNLYRYQNKLIFNTGSVGNPNEMKNLGNEEDETNKFSTMASYSILEGEYKQKQLAPITICNVRVPYDIPKEIEIIEKSDFPQKKELIFLLKTGCFKKGER